MYGFNNQYQQGYGAPYMGQYGQASQQACQITRVNGRNGADAFRMAPNSSILLLDENDPVVWLKVSDGAGYCTVTPYSIAPYQDPAQELSQYLKTYLPPKIKGNFVQFYKTYKMVAFYFTTHKTCAIIALQNLMQTTKNQTPIGNLRFAGL